MTTAVKQLECHLTSTPDRRLVVTHSEQRTGTLAKAAAPYTLLIVVMGGLENVIRDFRLTPKAATTKAFLKAYGIPDAVNHKAQEDDAWITNWIDDRMIHCIKIHFSDDSWVSYRRLIY